MKYRRRLKAVAVIMLVTIVLTSCGRSGSTGDSLEEIMAEDLEESGQAGLPSGTVSEDSQRGESKEASSSAYTRHEVPENTEGRIVVTLGMTDIDGSAMTPEIVEIIKNFNNERDDICVEIIYYTSDEYDYDARIDRMKVDLATGNAPDIIDVSGALDYDVLGMTGVFADLYTLMEDDFRKQLLPSILKAAETDGKLYALCNSFNLETIWGSSAVTGGKQGVTLAEMMQLLKEHGKDLNAIYGFPGSPLGVLLSTSMDEFVDWSEGTCDFTGDEFKEFLKFVKDYRGGFQSRNIMEAIHSGEIVMTESPIYKVSDYQIQKELYGDDISFIGLPTQKETGIAAYLSGSLAINSRCAHQEEAWEFLKYYIQNCSTPDNFPILRERFDQMMADAMTEDLAENGERIVKATAVGNDILVFAAKQEDVDAVRELVEKVDGKRKNHPEIQAIIEEEASYYLNGKKDVDAVAEIIQNRMTIYLQERKW